MVGEGILFLKSISDGCLQPWSVWVIIGRKDLQNFNITSHILFWLVVSQLPFTYTSIGEDYNEQVLPSITTEILKYAVAGYDAGKLIIQWELFYREVRSDLTDGTATFGLNLYEMSLTHLTFRKQFREVVEAQQVAQQKVRPELWWTEWAAEEGSHFFCRRFQTAELIDLQPAAIAGDGFTDWAVWARRGWGHYIAALLFWDYHLPASCAVGAASPAWCPRSPLAPF